MKVTGVICEYNPLHLGHARQLHTIRTLAGADSGIVCLMSGNYVQRGAPAVIDKSIRARTALACGADLVLELPIAASLSSAEGFAQTGVGILSGFCHSLCFGAETADPQVLWETAQTLLSPAFSQALRRELDSGISFPAARQRAAEQLGVPGTLLNQPNNILAVEYCKAILRLDSPMEPMPIFRGGSYHAPLPDPENPSATALRSRLLAGEDCSPWLPPQTRETVAQAAVHALRFGERAILARLRTMSDGEFEALPYGSEGLWRKLMHESRRGAALEDILSAVKSKRYTRTRLDRMVMCAFLGLTREALLTPAPYIRVLGLNDTGRKILNRARETGVFLNAGEATDHPYCQWEYRAGDLYGLFSQGTPEPPGVERRRRVAYFPSQRA